MHVWSLMESDINSEAHRSPDEIPEKGYVHTLTQMVCHNFRSTTLVCITVGVNSVRFTLDHTLLMLALRGEDRKKKAEVE